MESVILQIEDFKKALVQIDRVKATEIFEKSYTDNKNFKTLEHLAIGSLEKIGDEWEEGKLSLSQVYMSGIICEDLVENYLPKFSFSYNKNPKIAIAVLQDYHALGKRIVYSIIRASGYDIIDFGQGLSVEEILEKTIEQKIEFLLISTLMLNSALQVKRLVEILKKINPDVKIIVGGAPFRLDEGLWEKVNADADGKTGTEVIKIIEQMSNGGQL